MLPLIKIICPVDFSTTSYDALKNAEQLARQTKAELILLHVIPFPTPNDQGFTSEEEAYAFAYETAEKELQRVIDTQLNDLKVRHLIRSGTPAGQITVDVARNIEADLIVIGTHGWTGWRRLVLGSVTEKVLQLADCPVLTVQSGVDKVTNGGAPIKVLCPIDFSEPSVQALEVAGQIAESLNGEISILHVLDRGSLGFGDASGEKLKKEATLQAMLPLIEAHVPAALQSSAQLNRLTRRGNPGSEIVEAAKEGGFNLIVMATQGETGWKQFFVGSVAAEVVRTATCPVLTIGHGVREKAKVAPAILPGSEKNDASKT